MIPRARSLSLLPVLLVLLVLNACGDGADAEPAPADPADPGATLMVQDVWVRAADGAMTAAFGVLTNTGDEDRVLVGAATEVAGEVELHEVVQSGGAAVMQERPEGFAVPAGGSHELAPGADHLMLMELTGPLEVGEQVRLVLTFDDGTEVAVDAVVKEAPAGDEKYHGDGHADGHADGHGDGHGEDHGEDHDR